MNSELPTATEYLDGFRRELDRIEASEASGAALELAAGISKAVEVVRELKKRNRKLFIVGNGGSAAIASHLGVDYWKNGQMRAIVLNDPAFLTCISNDYGYPYVFEKQLETLCDGDDGLIAISSSGKSENILRAVKSARSRGLRTITLSGFAPANPLRSLGDLNFYVPSTVYNYVETLHMLLGTCIIDCMTLPKEALLISR